MLETVLYSDLDAPTSDCAVHVTVVRVVHDVVKPASVSKATVPLGSTTAKFKPVMVATEPAVMTVFFGVSIEVIGASYVKACPRVPTTLATVSAESSEPESPDGDRHKTAVFVIHEVVWHGYTPLPMTAVTVRSASTKLTPPIVNETMFDVAVL
jgi:hypothetical protein